jgi:hypothetical protein
MTLHPLSTLDGQVKFVANSLVDICLALDEIRYDLREILALVHQREDDLESRLMSLENVVHDGLFHQEEDEDGALF